MPNSGINSVKRSSGIDCPVDFIKIDENRARVVAFFTSVFALFYFFNGNPFIMVLLLADFLLRVFNQNAYSPMALLSGVIVKQFGLKPKPVDRAPKRFAAFVGVLFLSAILAASFAGLLFIAKIITATLIIFACLESFMGFCAGCHVYTLINRFRGRQ